MNDWGTITIMLFIHVIISEVFLDQERMYHGVKPVKMAWLLPIRNAHHATLAVVSEWCLNGDIDVIDKTIHINTGGDR